MEEAMMTRNRELLDLLLGKYGIVLPGDFREKAVVEAAKGDDTGWLEALLENGLDANAADEALNPALHLVATPEQARLLMEAGADPRKRDSQGRTALHRHVGSPSILAMILGCMEDDAAAPAPQEPQGQKRPRDDEEDANPLRRSNRRRPGPGGGAAD